MHELGDPVNLKIGAESETEETLDIKRLQKDWFGHREMALKMLLI